MAWTEQNDQLTATFEFENFVDAFAFMTAVAFQAEAQQHHPEWTNVYNKVTVRLSTHDAGNTVTEKDHQLARSIDEVYQKFRR